jgi:hypothetical protein
MPCFLFIGIFRLSGWKLFAQLPDHLLCSLSDLRLSFLAYRSVAHAMWASRTASASGFAPFSISETQ